MYQDYTAAVDTVKQAHQEKKFKVREAATIIICFQLNLMSR